MQCVRTMAILRACLLSVAMMPRSLVAALSVKVTTGSSRLMSFPPSPVFARGPEVEGRTHPFAREGQARARGAPDDERGPHGRLPQPPREEAAVVAVAVTPERPEEAREPRAQP